MSVVELNPVKPVARVELGAPEHPRNPADIEFGLIDMTTQLARMRRQGLVCDVPGLIRLAADIGTYEVLVLLRDLQAALEAGDIPARAALLARLDRQIEADMDFVLSLGDPTGQFDQ